MLEKKHVGILHLKWKQLNGKERSFTPALLLRFWTNKQHSQPTRDQMPSRLRKRITIAVPLSFRRREGHPPHCVSRRRKIFKPPPKRTWWKTRSQKWNHKKLNQRWGRGCNKQHKVDKMKLNCRIVKSSAKFIARHDKNSHRWYG